MTSVTATGQVQPALNWKYVKAHPEVTKKVDQLVTGLGFDLKTTENERFVFSQFIEGKEIKKGNVSSFVKEILLKARSAPHFQKEVYESAIFLLNRLQKTNHDFFSPYAAVEVALKKVIIEVGSKSSKPAEEIKNTSQKVSAVKKRINARLEIERISLEKRNMSLNSIFIPISLTSSLVGAVLGFGVLAFGAFFLPVGLILAIGMGLPLIPTVGLAIACFAQDRKVENLLKDTLIFNKIREGVMINEFSESLDFERAGDHRVYDFYSKFLKTHTN